MSVPRKNQIDRGARDRPAAGAALAARQNFGLRLVRNSRGSVAVNDGRKQGLPVNYEKCRVLTGDGEDGIEMKMMVINKKYYRYKVVTTK